MNGLSTMRLEGWLETFIFTLLSMSLLLSATQLWQGNVFTPVCQSFCSQGRGCVADTSPGRHTPPRDTPWADTAPGQTHTPGRHTPVQTHPPGQTPLCADTPRQIPQSKHTLVDTPQAYPSDRHHPPPTHRQPLQRTVRILLECFLVYNQTPCKSLATSGYLLLVPVEMSSSFYVFRLITSDGRKVLHVSVSIYKQNVRKISHKPLADPRGGARDARPPLGVQILSFSCSFRQKCEK